VLPLRDDIPSETSPVVNYVLIGVNVVMFVYELMLGERLDAFLMQAAFVPSQLGAAGHGFEIHNALLSMFLHGGWAHIGGNMLFLWIFGDNVEDRLGHLRYLIFYLGCGFVAAYAHALANPQSPVPAIGASGAIAGVLGAYLCLYPRARILSVVTLGFFLRTVAVPALVYLPFWFLLQLVSGVAAISRAGADATGGGVAFWAHIGGFLAGPVLLFVLGGFRRRAPRPASPPPWG
jgi:membrane associated rhomboid family serine protease